MIGKRGMMRRGAAIAGLLLAVLAGCAEPGSDGGQASVTVGFAALQTQAVARTFQPQVAGGLTTDIASYTLAISETAAPATVWYSATTPGTSASTITATVPATVALDFNVAAKNGSGTVIFTGALTNVTLAAGAQSVTIGLTAVQAGGATGIPTITGVTAGAIIRGSTCSSGGLCPGDSVQLTANVSGPAAMVVTFQDVSVLPDPAGFPDTPAANPVAAGAGTAVETWTAPAAAGGTTFQGSVTVASGTAGAPDYVAVRMLLTFTVNNAAPVANAGANQGVVTGALVTLDGSGSFDGNGDPITYAWTIVSVPGGSAVTTGSLSNATFASPTFTPDAAGSYVWQLIVSDGALSSAASQVTITASTPVAVTGVVLTVGAAAVASSVDVTASTYTATITPSTAYTVTLSNLTPVGNVTVTVTDDDGTSVPVNCPGLSTDTIVACVFTTGPLGANLSITVNGSATGSGVFYDIAVQ